MPGDHVERAAPDRSGGPQDGYPFHWHVTEECCVRVPLTVYRVQEPCRYTVRSSPYTSHIILRWSAVNEDAIEQRRGKEQAVDHVQDTTQPRKRGAGVLHLAVALQQGFRQVAELPAEAEEGTQ